MGFGLGSFGQAAGLVGGKGLGQLASSAKSTFFPNQAVAEGVTREALQDKAAASVIEAQKASLGQKALQFAKQNKLLTGALGIGALGAMGAFKEEDKTDIAPPPEAGSQGMLDISPGQIAYYDPATRSYGAASPQIPEIYRAKDGGDIKNFPRKTGQIDGPGTEKSDDIPAMLSDGEVA
jgi:hypothetical protein